MLFYLLFFCLINVGQSLDVVGWFVGNDLKEFNNMDWDNYTIMRLGSLNLLPNGTQIVTNDSLFINALTIARGNKITINIAGSTPVNKCIIGPIDIDYCNQYIRSLPIALEPYGKLISGIEFDFEWSNLISKLGHIKQEYVDNFSILMDRMQKAVGGNFTVSCDVSVYFLPYTRWVNGTVFHNNPNLFVNTMSYHWPKDCSIFPWKLDVLAINNEWGVPKGQINIGIGYFSMNRTVQGKLVGEPLWKTLEKICPDNTYNDCKCDDIYYTSPKMNYEIGKFVRDEGYRGLFPWAANYDSQNMSLVSYAVKGLYENKI